MYCYENGTSYSYDFRKLIHNNICRSCLKIKKWSNIFVLLTFALVTERVQKIFVLTFVPITET